jgi:hypothetical protein
MGFLEAILLVPLIAFAGVAFFFVASAFFFAIRSVWGSDDDILVRIVWVAIMLAAPFLGTFIYLLVARPEAGKAFFQIWRDLIEALRRRVGFLRR